MTDRKKPTPRDVTYTGDRVRMTDTAQERVEDWTDEELATTLEHSATLLNAGIDTLAENEHLVGRYMEAARRLRARQREGGNPGIKDLEDATGHPTATAYPNRTPQREGEREPVGLQLVERDAFESLEVGINGHERREAQDALDFIRREYEKLKQKVADLRRGTKVWPADTEPPADTEGARP